MQSSVCKPGPTAGCATIRLPSTCGEWVQGTLDGIPCLVSCAIDWYMQVTVTLDDTRYWRLPVDAPKAAAALHLALSARQLVGIGGELRINNPLPRGRGYASSTADVAGAIYAFGQAVGQPFSAVEVARLAVQVEPSDSTMFASPTLFAYRDASFYRPLGRLPSLGIVVLDGGGAVDTLAFNAIDHTIVLRKLAPVHREAFTRLAAGLETGDPVEVAQAATLSAAAHQAILPSALVEATLAAYPDLGAWGICRAHSGTLVGLVCRSEEASAVAQRAAARFPGVIVRPRRCVG